MRERDMYMSGVFVCRSMYMSIIERERRIEKDRETKTGRQSKKEREGKTER